MGEEMIVNKIVIAHSIQTSNGKLDPFPPKLNSADDKFIRNNDHIY